LPGGLAGLRKGVASLAAALLEDIRYQEIPAAPGHKPLDPHQYDVTAAAAGHVNVGFLLLKIAQGLGHLGSVAQGRRVAKA